MHCLSIATNTDISEIADIYLNNKIYAMTKQTLKQRYESACNEYAELFAKKHGMLFDGWVSDEIGGYAWFADYYNVSMEVIRQNIDENHGVDTFFNWYRSVENGSTVNYSSYIKGAPLTYNE